MLVRLTPEPAVLAQDLGDGLRAFQNLRSPRPCTGWFKGTPRKREGPDGEAVQALIEARKYPILRAVSRAKITRRIRWFLQALVACLVLISPISAQEFDLLAAPAKSVPEKRLRRSVPISSIKALLSADGRALKGLHQRGPVLGPRSVIAAAVSAQRLATQKNLEGRNRLPELGGWLFQVMKAASAKTASERP